MILSDLVMFGFTFIFNWSIHDYHNAVYVSLVFSDLFLLRVIILSMSKNFQKQFFFIHPRIVVVAIFVGVRFCGIGEFLLGMDGCNPCLFPLEVHPFGGCPSPLEQPPTWDQRYSYLPPGGIFSYFPKDYSLPEGYCPNTGLGWGLTCGEVWSGSWRGWYLSF